MKPKASLRNYLAAIGASIVAISSAHAADWTPTAAGTYSWNQNSTPPWTGGLFPNAVDGVANLNFDITGNQTINLNQAITIGTLNFGDTSGAQTQLIAPNGGSLTFDVSAGNATLTKAAGGTANSTISAPITLNDTLVATNNSTVRIVMSGIVSGSGGITLEGGYLEMRSGTAQHAYIGNLTINGGTLLYDYTGGAGDGLGSGNVTITNGVLENYWSDTFVRTLGAGPGQFQITGGTSGFSGQGSAGMTVRLNNNAAFEVVWGSTHFNPSTLVLQASTANTNGSVNFQNRIDLNGATRTVAVNKDHMGANGWGLLSGVIRDGTGGSAGLIKAGVGTLRLTAANEFTGGVEISAGTVRLENNLGLGNGGPLSFTGSGSMLDLRASPTVGSLSGTGSFGLITAGAAGARTLTVNQATDTTFGGVIQNGLGTVALTKSGAGALTLSGVNTYSGATTISNGTLAVTGTGSINNSAVTLNGGTFVYNSSVTHTNTFNFTSGTLGGTNLIGNLGGQTIGANQTISPGNSPGTAVTTSQTWAAGGDYLWEINNATGTAGADPGWDLINGSGNLNITALSGDPFTILVTSLTPSNTSGVVDNFDDLTSYEWLIADFATVTGFTEDAFNIDTSGFLNPFTGTFGISLGGEGTVPGDDSQIYLTYTSVPVDVIPEPSTAILSALGLLALLRRKR